MQVNTLRITAVAALAALAACSGGSGGLLTPGGPNAGQSAPESGSRATLTIVVPHASGTAASARRAPRYVSPSTASLQVAVNGGAATTYGLTPSSPGCGVQAGNVTCTFSIAAPAGSDTLALTLADGVGNVLSRNVVTATVVAGVATPVSVTLAGVPKSIAIVPGAGAAVDGTSPSYRAAGLFPQPIEIEALDADGNVIIGPGAPTITDVSVTSGAPYATVASANSNDPAAYRLKPVDGTAGGKTVSVSATVQGVPLADGTTSPPLTASIGYTFTPAIAVASGPFVEVFSVESHKPVGQILLCHGCPITAARGIVSDSKGALYVLSITFLLGTSTNVQIFPPGATAATTTLGSAQGVHASSGIALDANGTLYVANGTGFRQGRPSVIKFPPGATTPSYTITNTPVEPGGIAVDRSGNIYLADESGAVLVYPPNTQTPSTTLSDPSLGFPTALALDASGGLYVADFSNNDIAYFAAGQTALTTTLNDGTFGSGVSQLMLDPTGNLWATVNTSQSIERLAAGALPNAVSVVDTLGFGGSMAWIP